MDPRKQERQDLLAKMGLEFLRPGSLLNVPDPRGVPDYSNTYNPIPEGARINVEDPNTFWGAWSQAPDLARKLGAVTDFISPSRMAGLKNYGDPPGIPNVAANTDLGLRRDLPAALGAVYKPWEKASEDFISRLPHRNLQGLSGPAGQGIGDFNPSLTANEDRGIMEALGGNTQGLTKKQLAKLGHMQMSGASDEEIQATLSEMREGGFMSEGEIEIIPEDSSEYDDFAYKGSQVSDGQNYSQFSAPGMEFTSEPNRPAISDTERARLDSFTKEETWRGIFGEDTAAGVESSFNPGEWGAMEWIGRGAFAPINMLDTILSEATGALGMGKSFNRERATMLAEAQEQMALEERREMFASRGVASPQTEHEKREYQVMAAMDAAAKNAFGVSSSKERPEAKQSGWMEFLFKNTRDKDREHMAQRKKTMLAMGKTNRMAGILESVQQQFDDADQSRRDEKTLHYQGMNAQANVMGATLSAQDFKRRGQIQDREEARQTWLDKRGVVNESIERERQRLERARETGQIDARQAMESLKLGMKVLGSDMSEDLKGRILAPIMDLENTGIFRDEYRPNLQGIAPDEWGGYVDVTQQQIDKIGDSLDAMDQALLAVDSERFPKMIGTKTVKTEAAMLKGLAKLYADKASPGEIDAFLDQHGARQ